MRRPPLRRRRSRRPARPAADRGRTFTPTRPLAHPIDPRADALRAEPPGPDGVRRGLVDYVRSLIAAGEYDTPDRWAVAEARLAAAAEAADPD